MPRLFTHDHAYIFQTPDKRIIFATPYQQSFTLIGTTDIELARGDIDAPRIDDSEIAYLCEQVSRYFAKPVRPADVVWTYSGVRPLLDDESGNPSAVTRDYLLERNVHGAPLLSVWGGKVATFRKKAEDAADALGEMLGDKRKPWTGAALLPGGNLDERGKTEPVGGKPQERFARFVESVKIQYPWLPSALVQRLARASGTRIQIILAGTNKLGDLGCELAPGLFERELQYLCDEEWACSGDEVMWRRS